MLSALFGSTGGDAAPQPDSVVDDVGGVADQPHLTGDPEWDAIEMEETDPTKPPLQIVR